MSTTENTVNNSIILALCKGYLYTDIYELPEEQINLLPGNPFTTPERLLEKFQKVCKQIIEKNELYKWADNREVLTLLRWIKRGDYEFGKGVGAAEAAIMESIIEKTINRLNDRATRHARSTRNRATYLPTTRLTYKVSMDRSFINRSYDVSVQSSGLLKHILQDLGLDGDGEGAIRMLDAVKTKGMSKEDRARWVELQLKEFDNLRKNNLLPSEGKLAFHWGEESATKALMLAPFRKAIDFAGYASRVEAPLRPGGFFKCTVHMCEPYAKEYHVEEREVLSAAKIAVFEHLEAKKTPDAVLIVLGKLFTTATTMAGFKSMVANQGIKFNMEAFENAYKVEHGEIRITIPMATDGSGLYNPNHPMWQEFIAIHGVHTIQFSAMKPDGFFAKGILVPREGLSDDIAVIIDPVQVKGAMKGKMSSGDVINHVYLGVMDVWNRLGYYPGNFEMLEKVVSSPDREEELVATLKSLIDEDINILKEKGLDTLLSRIAKKNEEHATILKVMAKMETMGHKINPMALRTIQSAVSDELGSRLWILHQGAGIKGRQYVTVLDASVPEGCCVGPAMAWGKEHAIWRYPCVLPQGLVVAKAIPPSPHHLWNGKQIPNTIFLNPRDLTGRMQGDDDGDIVGVSSDPRVIKLFKMRKVLIEEGEVFAIEPKGTKFDILTDSERGWKYVEVDPRGPVGLTTNWLSQLIAAGDWWGALALAVLNQEVIDCAKKKVQWTDPRKACERNNWIKMEDNQFHLKSGLLNEGEYEEHHGMPEGFPLELVSSFVGDRLESHGVKVKCKLSEKQNPIAWKVQKNIFNGVEVNISGTKRIPPFNWKKTYLKSNGWAPKKENATVHRIADYSQAKWQLLMNEWELLLNPEQQEDMRLIIPKMMKANGFSVRNQCSCWEEYKELRKKSGIDKYGEEWKRLIQLGLEGSSKFEAIEECQRNLYMKLKECTPAELATIFYWENTPVWKNGNKYSMEEQKGNGWYQTNRPSYGFMAISFPSSPIMKMIGIEEEDGCSWAADKAVKFAKWATAGGKADMWEKVNNLLFTSTAHGDETAKHGQRVELHQCQKCMELLVNVTMKEYRAQKFDGAEDSMKALIKALKEVSLPWMPMAEEEVDDMWEHQENMWTE